MKLNIKRDETGQKYIEVDVSGYDLINNPVLNKGRSFTAEERIAFRLRGIVPPAYLPPSEIEAGTDVRVVQEFPEIEYL